MIYEKVHPEAKVPTKVHLEDAGFDLFTPQEFVLPSSGLIRLSLGFRLQLPIKTAGILMGRSGLAVKGVDPLEFLDPETNRLLGGLIDCNYVGIWGVILKNLGSSNVSFSIGDKICQFVVVNLSDDEIVEGSVPEPMSVVGETSRGSKGFGSSDVKLPMVPRSKN